MTKKEYKTKLLAREPTRIKILHFLCIVQFKCTKDPAFNRWQYKRRLNPWHPLSYIVMLLVVLVTGIIEVTKSVPEMIRQFKYH